MSSPKASIRIQRRLEWMDTDAAGHWHYSAVFRLVESAERVLLDRLGILGDVYGRGVPRVHLEADFRRSVRFNELADIVLEVVDVRRSSITYRAEITRDGELCAEASFVAVLRDEAGQAAAWPEDYRRLLLTAGPQQPQVLE